MFIVELTYTVPLDAIDALMPRHVAYMRELSAGTTVLAAGPLQPRTGGILLARGTRAEVEAIACGLPFVAEGAATFRVLEMAFGYVAPGLEALRG